MRETLLPGSRLTGLAGAESAVQVMDDGWNVGPDDDAMIERANRERHARALAMQDPAFACLRAATSR